ncbi:MAG: hypothetical protein ACUVSX_16560 [Aggregatilineales bacterium]
MTDEHAQGRARDGDLLDENELRFAPPLDAPDAAAVEEALAAAGLDAPVADAPDAAKLAGADAALEMAQARAAPAPFDALDVDAALAAVSRLDDILAEEEAAEQARLAREQAEAEQAAQRAARLKHPERFFAMPPLLTVQRGRVDSVVPALALIGLGVWLTFALTTSETPPDATLALAAGTAALALTFIARWLAAGRWARGALLLALLTLAGAAALYAVAVGPGLIVGWPLLLLAPAAALIGVGLLARPSQPRLLLPAALLAAAGLAGYAVTAELIPLDTQAQIAPLWPAAAVALAIVLALPLLRRR